MRTRTITGIALVIGLVGAGSAVGAPSGGKASGGTNFVSSGGFNDHRSFTAQGTSTDAKGQIESRVTDPVTGARVRQFHGVVTCYRQLGPKEALLGGVITDDQGNPPEEVAGDYFLWHVQDNGEGAKAAPDMIGAQRGPTPQFGNCDTQTPPPAGQPVVDGNIQVSR
jgi:hypothetical protein